MSDINEYEEAVQHIMNFTDYEVVARRTAIYPNQGANIIYPTLGLCGESGEIAEKVKKIIRDDNGTISAEAIRLLQLELGDVLWYIAAICRELGITLESVARSNVEKLMSRMERDSLRGSGDER